MRIRTEIARFERHVRTVADPRRAAGEKRYLKSELDFCGVGVPELRRIVSAWLRSHRDLSRLDLIRLTRALFRRRLHELRVIAILLLEARHSLLEADDLAIVEWMLRRSRTWAYVDALAIHVAGPLIERYSKPRRDLDRWSRDDDFWLRRAAMLALLTPLKRGNGDWKRFVRYADLMLEDREFFIRKAIGWILRERAKRRPEQVRDFLRVRIDRVAGLTLREGVRYLARGDRDELLAAYRARA